ncbi:tellurite resistance TerB family protein [Ferrimonas sediminicola]|uniref:Tellurite resistance TerB family protein n=1 Tax=Ferrimonas sediminicola TaxID=2569538 RepID=A0A4U1BFI3_9GAMM|nr:tellurite resistance TerB family protein [Ferrimonas sediminicola]TKB49877.1 tellurite resistance TerB family protein [Ferrimonas sediminicola]
MDFKGLLNQVMASGGDMARQAKGGLNQGSGQGGISDMTKGAIGGAVGGSLLTLLVGSKKGRKMGKKAAKLGGAAALGALAYKVFNDWQANQGGGQPQAGVQPAAVEAASPPGLPVATERHSMVVLKAMIAAAKSDGHVDDQEKGRIFEAVHAMGASAEVSAFVQQELDKPLDPAEIAAEVSGPEEAAEVYLASVLMVDEQNFMEQAYLKELANQLRLNPELVAQLEAQLAQ